MDLHREQRMGELIAELGAIPLARRSPGQSYELVALTLALKMAAYEHAAELERLAAEKLEEPYAPPRDEEDERHWDMICRRGPELLMRFGTDARDGVNAH
jgi:hypothetical protein